MRLSLISAFLSGHAAESWSSVVSIVAERFAKEASREIVQQSVVALHCICCCIALMEVAECIWAKSEIDVSQTSLPRRTNGWMQSTYVYHRGHLSTARQRFKSEAYLGILNSYIVHEVRSWPILRQHRSLVASRWENASTIAVHCQRSPCSVSSCNR